MVAMIAKESKQKAQMEETGGSAHSERHTDSRPSSVNHIHLVWDEDQSWKPSSTCFCENTSLILNNGSVNITIGGFYHAYAQVTLVNLVNNRHGTVTLVANEDGKRARKLSEADYGNGSVSMSGVILLRSGYKVRLNIESQIRRDPSKTYWGLYLLNKLKDE
ncbi:lymphotoxin-alpha [Clarias gariepinus]